MHVSFALISQSNMKHEWDSSVRNIWPRSLSGWVTQPPQQIYNHQLKLFFMTILDISLFCLAVYYCVGALTVIFLVVHTSAFNSQVDHVFIYSQENEQTNLLTFRKISFVINFSSSTSCLVCCVIQNTEHTGKNSRSHSVLFDDHASPKNVLPEKSVVSLSW